MGSGATGGSKERVRRRPIWHPLPSGGPIRPRATEAGPTGEEPTLDAPSGARGGPERAIPAPAVLRGRYVLHEELGRGGMGRVLRATDRELEREVAVKLVADPSAGAAVLARFVAEARITGQLEHPNIVPVHDGGITEAGEAFFVMKRVEGRSLREVLDDLRAGDPLAATRWTRHRLLSAFVQVGHAVAYAHDRGVLHRDLKPANVMVGRFGEVLVMDWGLARAPLEAERRGDRAGEEGPGRTLDGAAIGTPGYMSPEQARGELDALDARSDVWSLGAILYEIVTLERAIPGDDTLTLLFNTVAGAPADPRARAPDRSVPDELAALCLRALQPEPPARPSSAAELVGAVEQFLEGARRREAAHGHVRAAEEAFERLVAAEDERARRTAEERTLADAIPLWAPLPEKAALLAARDAVARLGPAAVRAFAETQAACEKALSQDPENRDARAVLARAHFRRFEQADAVGDEEARLYHAERVRAHDDGSLAQALLGTGSLTLATDPPGAEVHVARFAREGLVWALSEPVLLGRTPLVDAPLPMGSYLVHLRAPGRAEARYPVLITRSRRWTSGPEPIPLFREEAIAEGFAYVPAGPFLYGGDPDAPETGPRREVWEPGFLIGVLPVTMQDYCDFVNAMHTRDPEEAWRRCPRRDTATAEGGAPYWERPSPGGRYVVPLRDRDGDPWDPRWPVASVSWHDARAYAAWRSERDGVPTALPTETQWEKAARGVDGRLFPWGDAFDPTLCKMRDSRPGRALLEPVGAFPTDVSAYGVRDMAGGNRDWCGEDSFGEDRTRRPVRGGSWYSSTRLCRVTNRVANEPWAILANYGFRVVRALPGA